MFKVVNELNPDCLLVYEASIKLLKNLLTKDGFVASTEDTANYRRVWGRDGVVAGLASLVSGNKELIQGFRLTLETLKKYQDKTGRIASNVDVANNKVSFGTTVGRVDASIWYVIGVCQYVLVTKDSNVWQEFEDSVARAFFYLECLELNGRGLVNIPPGGDWADEYINEGYVLFDQMLYLIAQKLYFKVTKKPDLSEKADRLTELIKVNYFPKLENIDSPFVYHQAIFKKAVEDYKPPIPVTYFTSHNIRYHFDSFASSLLLLTNILDREDEKMIEQKLMSLADSSLPIIPAFYPVIDENHPLWGQLTDNYLYEFKNKPYYFHNGGRWPMVHGFFLASFEGSGKNELEAFARILREDDCVFHEFYQGQTGEPLGTTGLGFSASGYILSYEKIVNGRLPFLI